MKSTSAAGSSDFCLLASLNTRLSGYVVFVERRQRGDDSLLRRVTNLSRDALGVREIGFSFKRTVAFARTDRSAVRGPYQKSPIEYSYEY